MKINKHHGSYNVMKRVLGVKYIVVHYVGSGTSAAGSALANCKYFAGGNRQASANYFIDDSGIWEYADPEAYTTWHCGDGAGKYGITNANSIGIEVCMNGDKPFTEKEISYLQQLVTSLMKKFGVTADHVVRHYDASRKQCPLYYAKREAEWKKLRARITGSAAGWQQDSGVWHYYKNDGSLLINGWAKDSTGWCWLNGSGEITKDKWIKDGGYWYYLKANGYMAAKEWAKDSKGWCWLEASGKMASNRWLSYKGASYFLKADGHMATGSIRITESFDASGKWTGGKEA